MPAFVFRRSFPWLQRTLTPVIPIAGPNEILSTLLPVVDIFGTQQIENQEFAEVLGGVGNLEVFHDAVPPQRIRLYSAIEMTHDALLPSWVRIGQIVSPGPGVASFVGFQPAALRPAASSPQQGEGAIALRSLWVGPGNRAAGRINAIAAGEQLTLRLVWVEMVLGEAIRFT